MSVIIDKTKADALAGAAYYQTPPCAISFAKCRRVA